MSPSTRVSTAANMGILTASGQVLNGTPQSLLSEIDLIGLILSPEFTKVFFS